MDRVQRPKKELDDEEVKVHDSQVAGAYLDWEKKPLAIVTDKVYGGSRIRQQIADGGALAAISL